MAKSMASMGRGRMRRSTRTSGYESIKKICGSRRRQDVDKRKGGITAKEGKMME